MDLLRHTIGLVKLKSGDVISRSAVSIIADLMDLMGRHRGIAESIILSGANLLAGLGKEHIANEETYAEHIDQLWEILPAGVRIIGRDTIGWDKFMWTLRSRVFLIDDDKVLIHPEAKTLVRNWLHATLPGSKVGNVGLPKPGWVCEGERESPVPEFSPTKSNTSTDRRLPLPPWVTSEESEASAARVAEAAVAKHAV